MFACYQFNVKSRVDHYPVVVFLFITVTKPRGWGFDGSCQWFVTIMLSWQWSSIHCR